MKISIIVCAAGKGERAGFGKNKLLVPFMGSCALRHTLSAFDYLTSAQKIAVCAEGDYQAENLCRISGWQTVTGGATRTQSVYNALLKATGDIVVIHDGARPFVTREIIDGCIECAIENGSAICAYPSTDTIAIEEDGRVKSVPERAHVYCVQTPQCFNSEELKRAYNAALSDGDIYTDDGSVYSQYIKPATVCPCGSPQNKKLTYAHDFASGLPALPSVTDKSARVGIGIDVHAFGKEQSYITLCGVKIPHETGLVAHSDGDVAIHAVMDALLSGAGLEDIGHYFPDSDQKYSGADSLALLDEVVHIINKRGLKPSGVSLAIQAETPRLSPYVEQMKKNLTTRLSIKEDGASITAGTTEGLGFVGRKEGICAYCIAVLEEI